MMSIRPYGLMAYRMATEQSDAKSYRCPRD